MSNAPFKKKLAGLAIVVCCSALVAPAVAGAQQVSPTDQQYGDQVTVVEDSGTPSSGGSASASSSDSGLNGRVGPLPFTGFDVIAMAAVALAVTGLGLALQRAVSRRSSNPAS